jgi:hypothetical protein
MQASKEWGAVLHPCPPQGRLGHGPVHTQLVPVNVLQLVKLCHPHLSELQEDIRCHPLLKPVMSGGLGTELGLVQGLPLASCPEDIKNSIGTAAIRDTGPSASKAMRLDIRWEQGCQNGPQLIGNAEPGGGPIVWRARPCAFR